MSHETKPHASIPHCTVTVFGDGVETWRMDHGLVDEKNRKIGGRAAITGATSGVFELRIHATRDGVEFGALRRATVCTSLAEARAMAGLKLLRQRQAFERKYPRAKVPA